jgi:hypothetical protein
MNASGFQWIVAPKDQIIPNLEKYGEKVLVVVQAVATYWGQKIQDGARTGARWEDRTGNARGGIFFAVDGFGLEPITGTVTAEANKKFTDVAIEEGDDNTLIVVLAHTVFYGKYLELSNGGRFAIIMSTIEENLSDLDRMIHEVFD